MTHLTIREIADAWKDEKRPYVKRSTFAAYMLTLENHLLPYFGNMTELYRAQNEAVDGVMAGFWGKCF